MNTKKSGFSIIEVALVLAIAGLIFIMAFIALPSLQASQRDADRKARVMEFINAVKTYQTNNSRGALPTLVGNGPEKFTWTEAMDNASSSWRQLVHDYIDKEFEDPTGTKYTFYVAECLSESGRGIGTTEACSYGEGGNGYLNDEKPPRPINGLRAANANLENKLDYTIYVAIGATCDGDRMVKTNSNRSVAALQILERAGRYCYNT